jgi:hypothetical protein
LVYIEKLEIPHFRFNGYIKKIKQVIKIKIGKIQKKPTKG